MWDWLDIHKILFLNHWMTFLSYLHYFIPNMHAGIDFLCKYLQNIFNVTDLLLSGKLYDRWCMYTDV